MHAAATVTKVKQINHSTTAVCLWNISYSEGRASIWKWKIFWPKCT